MKKIFIILLFTINVCFGQKFNKCSIYLVDNYYGLPFDKKIVQDIVSTNDSTINLADLFQVVQNENSDRLVAFFATNRKAKTKSDITADKISYSLSGTVPKYDGYTVSAIKYQNKWFYIKDNQTSFMQSTIDSAKKYYFCETLLRSNFINCSNKKVNKNFWTSNEFDEVAVQKLWSQSDIEINKPYLGLPKLVASNLKDNFNAQKKRDDEKIYNEYFIPTIKKIKQNKGCEDVSSNQMKNDFILIYPPDRDIILCPITLKMYSDSLHTLKFLALKKIEDKYEMYEWKYLEPVKYKKRPYVSPLYETINSLTYWTYTMPYISNMDFWSKYVIKAQDNKLTYLQKLD